MISCVFVLLFSAICLGDVSITDEGDVGVNGKNVARIEVKNECDGAASVSASVECSSPISCSVSPTSATIAENATKKFTVTLTGRLWTQTSTVTFEISGSCEDGSEFTESTSFDATPPDYDLEIISPKKKISIVEKEGISTSFDAVVRNTGEGDLEGVEITIKSVYNTTNCDWDTSPNSLKPGESARYKVTCQNLTFSGRDISIEASESHDVAFDSELLRINVVGAIKNPGLEILAPLENELFEFTELPGKVTLEINNTGNVDFSDLSFLVEGMESSSDSFNLAVNEALNVTVFLMAPTGNGYARIAILTPGSNSALAEVTVRSFVAESIEITEPVLNETLNETVNETIVENNTTKSDEELPFWLASNIIKGIPDLALFVAIILVVAIIVYIGYREGPVAN